MTLAAVRDSVLPAPTSRVVYSQEELDRAWSERFCYIEGEPCAVQEPAPRVDFPNEIVVFVERNAPTLCHKFSVERVRLLTDGSVEIEVLEQEQAGCNCPRVFLTSSQVIAVAYVGEPRFTDRWTAVPCD